MVCWYQVFNIFAQYVTIATETCLSAKNWFFLFFFVVKNLLHVMIMKKFADRGFLAFWPFKNERKFRIKGTAKPPKFGKKGVSTTTGTSTKPWNVQTYHHHNHHHHHTSYYTDHQFPIINTNHFVIHHCEFYLFLNWAVLFICFMTNLLPMWKLSLFRTLRNHNFIVSTIASVKQHRVYKSL